MVDLNDLQQEWDSQPTYSEEKMNDIAMLVRSRSDSLRSTLFIRDMGEALAAVFIIVCFAPALFFVPGLLAKIGLCIAIFGAIEIVVLMNWVRSRGRSDFAALPLKEFLASELRSLDRQIALLQYVAWWYLLPLYAGCCLFVIGIDYSVDNPLFNYIISIFNIIFCSGYLAYCIYVWRLNQQARKTQLEPLRDVMQRTYDSVTAMEAPDDKTDLIKALADPKLDLSCGQSGGTSSTRVTWTITLVALVGVGIAITITAWTASYTLRADKNRQAIDMKRRDVDTNRQPTAHFRNATSVDELVIPLITSGDFKGMSVGIVAPDSQGNLRSETHHFGLVDFEQEYENPPRLPDDQTLYEVGGITKVFTGILLASAAERGEVTLDTPLSKLVAPGVSVPKHGDREITLLDIMTHRSGLPRLADNMLKIAPDDPYKYYTAARAEAFLSNHELQVAPGTRYRYSNFAVSYLGHVLTRVAGASDYDMLLQQRLTGPLEMLQTKVVLEYEKEQLPIGYSRSGRRASAWHFVLPGSGGVRSSIEDMNRFMAACIQPPGGVTGRAIDLAYEKKVDPLGSERAMGIGWMIHRDQSTRVQSGQTGGFRSAMFVNRPLRIGVCVLSNTADDTVDAVAARIVQMKVEASAARKSIKVDQPVSD